MRLKCRFTYIHIDSSYQRPKKSEDIDKRASEKLIFQTTIIIKKNSTLHREILVLKYGIQNTVKLVLVYAGTSGFLKLLDV